MYFDSLQFNLRASAPSRLRRHFPTLTGRRPVWVANLVESIVIVRTTCVEI